MATSGDRKAEVTKLITVTLGKIHESKTKQAKCGLNLRRSLLVASVLNKARDIYVTEVKNRRAVAASANTSSSNSEIDDHDDSQSECDSPAKMRRRLMTQRSLSCVEAQIDSTSDSSADHSVPYEMETEQQNDSVTSTSVLPVQSTITDTVLDTLADDSGMITVQTDKENSPPLKLESITSSCSRCLKRKSSQTDFDSDVDNNNKPSEKPDHTLSFSSRLVSYVPKKRLRSDSIDNSEPPMLEMLDTSENLKSSNANSLDSVQINCLVKIFSQQTFSDDSNTHTGEQSSRHNNNSTELDTFALCRDSIALTA